MPAPSHLTLSSNPRCDPAVHLQFVWFQFQEKVRRGLAPKTPRYVGGHLVTEATNATLNEHKSDIQKHWEHVQRLVSLHLQTQPALSSDLEDVMSSGRTLSSCRTARCKSPTPEEFQRQLWAPKPTGASAPRVSLCSQIPAMAHGPILAPHPGGHA